MRRLDHVRHNTAVVSEEETPRAREDSEANVEPQAHDEELSFPAHRHAMGIGKKIRTFDDGGQRWEHSRIKRVREREHCYDALQWRGMAGRIILSLQLAGFERGIQSLVSMEVCPTRGQKAQVMARCMFVPEYGERCGWGWGGGVRPGGSSSANQFIAGGGHPWGNEGRACSILQRRELWLRVPGFVR